MPDTRRSYEHVASVYFPIAIGVFAAIVLTSTGILIYGRLRRKEPGRRSHANLAEGGYALVLLCTAGFLMWWTFHTENREDPVVKHPGLRITVVAAQWAWRFTYPNGKTVTAVDTWSPPVAEVPLHTEIEIAGRSKDVIHGFWVPRLRFQRQLIPGETTRFDLYFSEGGSYLGECAVYCGLGHSRMHFALKAVSPAKFTRWLHGSAA